MTKILINPCRPNSTYLLAFLIMVIAFGFAFFIINFGNEGEQFQNPGKSLLKIFVMVLGEFEFDNLYDQTDSSSTITLVFTMLLLIGKVTKYLHIIVHDPPPPLHPTSVSSPCNKGGGEHTRRAVKGWGVNILEDARHRTYRAGIFKQSMGARNRVGIGLSYRPARLH